MHTQKTLPKLFWASAFTILTLSLVYGGDAQAATAPSEEAPTPTATSTPTPTPSPTPTPTPTPANDFSQVPPEYGYALAVILAVLLGGSFLASALKKEKKPTAESK